MIKRDGMLVLRFTASRPELRPFSLLKTGALKSKLYLRKKMLTAHQLIFNENAKKKKKKINKEVKLLKYSFTN